MRYLLDTNVVIDILRNDRVVEKRYRLETLKRSNIFICPIVYYEIVRGFRIVSASKRLKDFLNLSKEWEMLLFDMQATEKAIDIYEKVHKQVIEDNDIYIAAISMVNDCRLVTSNVRHFSRVEGLKFVNWRNFYGLDYTV